jgi:hypothetical protein
LPFFGHPRAGDLTGDRPTSPFSQSRYGEEGMHCIVIRSGDCNGLARHVAGLQSADRRAGGELVKNIDNGASPHHTITAKCWCGQRNLNPHSLSGRGSGGPWRRTMWSARFRLELEEAKGKRGRLKRNAASLRIEWFVLLDAVSSSTGQPGCSFVGQPCLLQTFEYHWCIDGVRLEPLDGDLWIKPPRLG